MPESLPAATSLRADKRIVPNPSGRGVLLKIGPAKLIHFAGTG